MSIREDFFKLYPDFPANLIEQYSDDTLALFVQSSDAYQAIVESISQYVYKNVTINNNIILFSPPPQIKETITIGDWSNIKKGVPDEVYEKTKDFTSLSCGYICFPNTVYATYDRRLITIDKKDYYYNIGEGLSIFGEPPRFISSYIKLQISAIHSYDLPKIAAENGILTLDTSYYDLLRYVDLYRSGVVTAEKNKSEARYNSEALKADIDAARKLDAEKRRIEDLYFTSLQQIEEKKRRAQSELLMISMTANQKLSK